MPIDLSRENAAGHGLHYSKLASIVFPDLGGVEAACVRITGNGKESFHVVTDEDFNDEEIDGAQVLLHDSSSEHHLHCKEARTRAQKQWMQEIREANAERWAGMELKDVVYDIAQRVWNGEWLGHRDSGVIYAQEVARLLDFPSPNAFGPSNPVWELIRKLRDEEKVDLSGAILIPYRAGFRFPEEIRSLFRYVVEEPLGWPNGDAGDGTLYKMENAITEAGIEHGKDVFWDENFPNLAPRHLLAFGTEWIHRALERAEGSNDLSVVQISAIREELEKAVEALRGLEKSESE